MLAPIVKRLLLSLLLITAAALVLLLSDLHSRERARGRTAGSSAKRTVALLKHASNALLDELEEGVLEQLATAGYADGGRLALRRFSAEGDLPTGNAIARQITDGSFEMVITLSTLSLQCVANANKDGRALHVFGGVTDPAGAGVGIQQMNTTNKPPWLAGMGSFQPVREILTEAKKFWPGLKVVGAVWNRAERNSEACILKARDSCKALGIQFIEATVDQSKDVAEAAESLVARGAEAILTGFDVTVLNATPTLCQVAHKAKIPVFSNNSGHVRSGTLFDLGANYREVGRAVGRLAASILDGARPESVPITNFMPERLTLNKQVLSNLRDPWRFPEDANASAALIIGPDGQIEKDASEKPLARLWRIQEASYNESVMVEEAMRGFRQGLKEAGLVEGQDYNLQTLCAQGDMASLGALFDSAKTSGTDLYMVYSTPTLQTAIRRVQDKPVVFTVVADPFQVGAGKTDTEHLANVTGVYTLGPYREMAQLLRDHFPTLKRVGTLFCPAEVNSVANKDLFVKEASKCGLEVETVPANTPAELSDAALALCGRRLDAVVQIIDNLSAAGFPAIARAASLSRLPVFACQGAAVREGAVLALARDYYDAGREAASKAALVMRGESPTRIPFSPPLKTKTLVNESKATELQFVIPEALLRKAERVTASGRS